jgi:ribosome-dependent ATPase
MTPGAAAEVLGLTHRYGRKAALDGVTLALPAGRMVGLIGPDGVGKSTLLALIAGVRAVQTGEVRTLGGDMKDPVHRRACHARIAYMPQGLGRSLYPTLSVVENLDFIGRLFGQSAAERAARIEELLAATALSAFPDRPVSKLSGGMKQKLGLCGALLHDPDLLVLDEPTTGVDPLSRRQFWELIERIRVRRPHLDVIVATAYMEEAERFDWLVAMDGGAILATGTPLELRSQTRAATLDDAFISLLPEERRKRRPELAYAPHQPDGGPPAIEAEGLTRRFGDFVAVDRVSFRIERGEIFGFLGSNGCGKTTTMKMLTGLLPPSAGEARLFGCPLDPKDMRTRRRVGYMSQSFSLYAELTVRQNLELHARLFHLPAERIAARVAEMLRDFDLESAADAAPEDLPLGIRQRLQLGVAVIHAPEVLILDEPTSGVDPIARDQFWRYLIELARGRSVTVFISTHFMNEAERCDRISLMHAGKVLAVGAPRELIRERGVDTLEEAFISHLAEVTENAEVAAPSSAPGEFGSPGARPRDGAAAIRRFELRRFWAYARRETIEILRDPIRLAFALLGPMVLMIAFGFGISFDVENLSYAAFDQDRSVESREFLESFSGSRYFAERPPISGIAELDHRLRSSEIRLAVEVPAGFGKDLMRGARPEVGIWLDGAMPFRAETARGYVGGVAAHFFADREERRVGRSIDAAPVRVESRFHYNQAFRSVYAIVPGVIMLMLVLIPAMMTAVGVVREKETGSIANFRSTPVTKLEFLAGKQAPYAVIALLSFASLVGLALTVFGVPVRGSAAALAAGAVLYVLATTAFGLLVSCFTRTQVAAIFGTAIITMLPSVNFSGFLSPVSGLSGGARVLGVSFPASWFQTISVGTFTKGLGFAELWTNHLALAGFTIAFLAAAEAALRKQEK